MSIIKKLIILSFSLMLCLTIWSQRSNNFSDTLSGFQRNIGYGAAHLAEITTNNSGYRPQVYFDYGQSSGKGYHYKLGLSFNYSRTRNGNIFQHELIPFNIVIGAEKHFYKQKFYFVVGGSVFYSMSVRKARLGPFQGDDYGVGVAPNLGVGFCLRENLSLYSEYAAGIGYFRSFVGVGTLAVPTLAVNFAPIRNFSFGLRHFF